MLNKQKGDMYPWVDYTFNPLAGRCKNNCLYCFMKTPPQSLTDKYKGDVRIHPNSLKGEIPEGNVIFVGSGNDIFVDNVPEKMIMKIIEYCKSYDCKYLFQSKNPKRFKEFINDFPKKSILGTTIETYDKDLSISMSRAPNVNKRIKAMKNLRKENKNIDMMISIEPIVEFKEPQVFANKIKPIEPLFVSIGADSRSQKEKNNNPIPEPNSEKIHKLIDLIENYTEVRKKNNLDRLL